MNIRRILLASVVGALVVVPAAVVVSPSLVDAADASARCVGFVMTDPAPDQFGYVCSATEALLTAEDPGSYAANGSVGVVQPDGSHHSLIDAQAVLSATLTLGPSSAPGVDVPEGYMVMTVPAQAWAASWACPSNVECDPGWYPYPRPSEADSGVNGITLPSVWSMQVHPTAARLAACSGTCGLQVGWLGNVSNLQGALNALDAHQEWPDPFDGYSAPASPVCEGFVIDSFAIDRGTGEYQAVSSLGEVGLMYPGYRLRFEVDHEDLQGVASLSYRWSGAQAWADVHTFAGSVSILPRVFSIERSGPAVNATALQFMCDGEGGERYWSGGSWTSLAEPDACASLSVVLAFKEESGDSSWLDLDAYLAAAVIPLIDGDGLVQVTVTGLIGSGMEGAARIDLVWPTDEAVIVGHFAEGVSVLPASVELTPPGQLDPRDITLVCTDQAGRGVSIGDGNGGWVPTETGSGGGADGSCFRFQGLSLTSPATWLRGLGSMLTCMFRSLFVPDRDVLAEEWDGLWTLAENRAPVSWTLGGLAAVGDATTGLQEGIEANDTGCWNPVQGLPAVFSFVSEDPDTNVCPAQLTAPGGDLDFWPDYRAILGMLVWASNALLWGGMLFRVGGG